MIIKGINNFNYYNFITIIGKNAFNQINPPYIILALFKK